MTKKIKLKTSKSNESVAAYINKLPTGQQSDAQILLDVFTNTTNAKPKMWGTSIIGFGEYTYYRSNGDAGQFLATGFSIRKSGPVLYIMPGYSDYTDILKDLGPHTVGKSCLYLKNLDKIHLPSLKKLIRSGLRDLKKSYSVTL